MPRDAGGVYSLHTPGNPVVPETIISSDWANPTLEDVASAMSDSLSRSGKGGMTAPLRGPDGSEGVPTFSFTSELDSGRWRQGPGQIVESIQGQKVVRFRAAGMDQWNPALNGGLGDWEPLTPRDAEGTPFDPAGIALVSTNVQDAIEEVYDATGGVTTADEVTYDDQRVPVYFPAATVQLAIDRLGVDVSAMATDISTLFGDIVILEGDLSIVEAQSLTNAADILVNAGNIQINNDNFIGFYNTEFLPLRTRVDNVEAHNIIQDADITFLLNEQNAQGTRISNNEINISTNANDIFLLDSRVTVNEGDINTIAASWFQGTGVLSVLHGGTGVTNKTGTGAGVHIQDPQLNSPDIYGGNVDGDMLGVTQVSTNNSTRLATTAFVQAAIDSAVSGQDITTGDTANGRYAAVYSGIGTWRVFCWSQGVWATGGTADQLPVTNLAGTVQMSAMYNNDAPVSGTPAVFGTIGPSAFTGYGTLGLGVRWTSMGEATYNSAFANTVPTDRYYNKVTRTEHLEIMHGDWTLDPDVVILPPGNTFWGPPLELNEVLSFDGGNLPLARVPRVISLEETLSILLRAAGVSQASLERALYLDGRGIPGPLNGIDAALDVLVISEGVTLETLVELV
jgi:hypothetical protein